jgi:hypothetical protein
MYLAGFNFVMVCNYKTEIYEKICNVCMAGMFLFALLSYLKNGVIYDYSNGSDIRAIPDLWTNTNWQATNINGYCLMSCILPLCNLLNEEEGKLKKIISIILLAVSLYISLVTAARTNLLMCIMAIAIYFMVLLMLKKMEIFIVDKRRFLNTLVILLAVTFLIPIVLLNAENILLKLPLEAFFTRMSNHTLSFSNDGRLEFWRSMIAEIPSHPFGNIKSVKAAHNLYLDVARVSGVIPMFILIIFTIMVIKTALKLISNDKYTEKFRIKNFIIVICLLASFLIEPVLEAKPFIFIMFCMICGMQKAYVINDTEDM